MNPAQNNTPAATAATPLTIGLDLGDRRHAYCVLDNQGQIVLEDALPNDRASLERLSQRYPAATLAMETGTHSPWISRLFEARGHQVYVANARKVRAISHSVTKTDEHDARILARLCRVDPALLSPVKHRSDQSGNTAPRTSPKPAPDPAHVHRLTPKPATWP